MEKKSLIFIVDDISDTAELLSYILVSTGHDTRIFYRGEEVLKALERADAENPLPDLILVDLMMPGIDGLEVINRIRKNSNIPFIPIIMITSSGDSQVRILGLQTGADDFLPKPVGRAELLARVGSLLRLKQVYDEKTHLLAEVQQAYHRLEAAQGDLIAAEKQKLQMDAMMTTAAGICHEMSQPLTSALISLQLLRPVITPENSEDLETIETSLLQARVILDKLRALTRYETKPYLGEEVILDLDRSSGEKVVLDFDTSFSQPKDQPTD